jgi:hypothetical protein
MGLGARVIRWMVWNRVNHNENRDDCQSAVT